jgi:hypothetical protein
VKIVNDVLFFAVELAALVAFGVWGWHLGSGVWRFVLAAALPVAFAVVWGFLAAPTSATRLTDPALLVFQLVAFLLAAVAVWATGRVGLGVTLGVVAVVVVGLDRVLA